ncbi:hypothetical protein [Amycolatopsis orientalis]|nr:hypothetical protein [Amycolatopsis orientalis]
MSGLLADFLGDLKKVREQAFGTLAAFAEELNDHPLRKGKRSNLPGSAR